MGKMPRAYSIIFRLIFAVLILAGCNSPAPPPRPASTVTALPKAHEDTVVSLTFDDGDTDNFAVSPMLKENGLRATFYITSGRVGSAGFMTWDQLQTLQKDGNEIGGHTLDHVKLQGLDIQNLRHQICDDRTNLLDHGLDAVSFAYPFGNYDENAKRMVKDCGYTNARAVRGDPVMIPPIDPYALSGFPYIVSDTELGKLEQYVKGTRNEGGGWVILIFHHVCDSCSYFSVSPHIMNGFTSWLAQQQNRGNVKVRTIGEVISGSPSH